MSDRRSGPPPDPRPRPVDVCRALLDALDATEGRRRRRKRNTGADAIGIGMKRKLLEGTLRDDPDPGEFEGWLMERCFEQGRGEGAWRAMALEIFDEWRMAEAAPTFGEWLAAGAPSDDKPEGRDGRAGRGDRRPRAGLPVLLAALLASPGLALAACGDGIDADGEDVPEIEIIEMDREARQRTGRTAEVLDHLLDGRGPGSTVYDPPVDLTRPAGAGAWPPPTGTHGDQAVGARPPAGPDSARSDAPDSASSIR
ncbi:MAG: hypothetical protein KY466_00655 [Gemmatimonadetes bacterium]|nr:hypothetical protein [Gemmatimonadota bacterium]